MNNLDLESDAIVLLRLARSYRGNGVIDVHIDKTGLTISVATADAARLLIGKHKVRPLDQSSLRPPMWVGIIGDAPVSIRIHTDRPAA